MLRYDYEYILSKKHDKYLTKDIIDIFCKLNIHKSNNKSYKHSFKINNDKYENNINLELNKLNNNNINTIFNNISVYLKNDIHIKYFLTTLINNSIIQHNIIINYILLYELFFKFSNKYNNFIIDYLYKIIINVTDSINYKEKYIGSFVFISYLYKLKIINYEDLMKFINIYFEDCDDTICNYKLNSILKICDNIYLDLDIDLQNKLKEYINNLIKIKQSKLKFLCLDIIDIINKY
tara:strand:+ start:448 stop:1155 length:708 start_codon:yes stop_codon:yes gene_type:complete